jgi:hypothetical protein
MDNMKYREPPDLRNCDTLARVRVIRKREGGRGKTNLDWEKAAEYSRTQPRQQRHACMFQKNRVLREAFVEREIPRSMVGKSVRGFDTAKTTGFLSHFIKRNPLGFRVHG